MNLRTHGLALLPGLAFLSGLLLVGCADDRHGGGGGFETGDLQARVSTPSGRAAARAMVWLVRSQGDTAPAKVIDSAWTNSAGIAVFKHAGKLDSSNGALYRSELGLDAKLGDSLGIATGGFKHSDSSVVALAKSGTVEAWLDSTKVIPTLFVPGSHFASTTSGSAPKSVLHIPQGDWNVRIKKPNTTGISQPVTVSDQPVQVGGPAWSTKPLLWSDSVASHANIIDSVLYRDTSIASPYRWRKWLGAVGPLTYSEALVTENGGITSLLTKATSVKGESQLCAGVSSAPLPPQGAILLTYKFTHDPDLDIGLVRTITLVDTSNNGVKILLARDQKLPLSITPLGNAHLGSDSIAEFATDPIKVTDWTLIWTAKYIELRQHEILLARYYSGWEPTQENSVQPILSLEVGSNSIGLEAEIQISSLRLYQPK